MRLLLDANLSPRLSEPLTAAGHDVAHVADLGLLSADDTTILERADSDDRVLVTAATDFPMLAALRRTSSPSIVLLRGVAELPAARAPSPPTSNKAPSSPSAPPESASDHSRSAERAATGQPHTRPLVGALAMPHTRPRRMRTDSSSMDRTDIQSSDHRL